MLIVKKKISREKRMYRNHNNTNRFHKFCILFWGHSLHLNRLAPGLSTYLRIQMRTRSSECVAHEHESVNRSPQSKIQLFRRTIGQLIDEFGKSRGQPI